MNQMFDMDVYDAKWTCKWTARKIQLFPQWFCVFLAPKNVIHGHVDMGDVYMYHVTQPSKGFSLVQGKG